MMECICGEDDIRRVSYMLMLSVALEIVSGSLAPSHCNSGCVRFRHNHTSLYKTINSTMSRNLQL